MDFTLFIDLFTLNKKLCEQKKQPVSTLRTSKSNVLGRNSTN